MRLLTELKRRNVFRMAALYIVAAWLIMQVAEVLIALGNLPDWVGPALPGGWARAFIVPVRAARPLLQ